MCRLHAGIAKFNALRRCLSRRVYWVWNVFDVEFYCLRSFNKINPADMNSGNEANTELLEQQPLSKTVHITLTQHDMTWSVDCVKLTRNIEEFHLQKESIMWEERIWVHWIVEIFETISMYVRQNSEFSCQYLAERRYDFYIRNIKLNSWCLNLCFVHLTNVNRKTKH